MDKSWEGVSGVGPGPGTPTQGLRETQGCQDPPGIKPVSVHWKCVCFTSGPPGKSLLSACLTKGGYRISGDLPRDVPAESPGWGPGETDSWTAFSEGGHRLDGSEALSSLGTLYGFGRGHFLECPEDSCVWGRMACGPTLGTQTVPPSPIRSVKKRQLNTQTQLYQVAGPRPSVHFRLEISRPSGKHQVFHVTLNISTTLSAGHEMPSVPWRCSPPCSWLFTHF